MYFETEGERWTIGLLPPRLTMLTIYPFLDSPIVACNWMSYTIRILSRLINGGSSLIHYLPRDLSTISVLLLICSSDLSDRCIGSNKS